MVNPAFSESQLKNLRRQNRHLASTHRRKLVFLQASRNPAHGSGRPFFVRDVPVPASFCSVPVASPFAPPAPVSAAPQLRPFHRPRRSVPSSPSRSRTPDKVRVCTVHAAVPHPHPARRERSLRHLSVRPSPLRLPALAAPQLRPFRRPLRFCPRLPASPARRTEFGFVLCALPFRITARHSGNGPVPESFCPAPVASPFAPRAPASVAPPFSLFPAATGRTGCSFGPAREKGCLTDLRQPRFYPYCYSGTSPNTQSENWKNSSDGPLHSYSRSRTFPPPPNMPLKGSKNLPDSSVRSRIAQPADRLPAPAAAGLSSSSHRSSGSPDR